ncbi:MAG: transglycosylase domain-containing protein, partial [Actinomycetota bacterium]
GYIPAAEAQALKGKRLRLSPRDIPAIADAPYFVDHVRRHLQTEFGTDRTFGGGLKVQTTLDRELQAAAEAAVGSNLGKPGEPSAAIVAIEPSTGAIRAMVGGMSFKEMKFNLATQGRRQTGSAFKAFTLAAAVEKGIALDSVWSGPGALTVPDPRCVGAGGVPWTVHNYGDATAGTMSLAQATANSVNTIYAQLATTVGPDAIVDMAHRMGIASELQPVCSITLGSQPVSPLEMTSGFATLAARGVYRPPSAVERVTSSSGDDLFLLDTEGKQVLKKKHADLVTYALQGVIKSGTGMGADIGRPAAGKTGTAQNYQDAWFCGYVPQLAACVWVGYPEGAIPMLGVRGYPEVFGGSIPTDIWHDFMAEALGSMPVAPFADPFGRPESSEDSIFSEGPVGPVESIAPTASASPSLVSEPSPTPKPSPTDPTPQPLVTITP